MAELKWTGVIGKDTTKITSINGQKLPDGAVQIVSTRPSEDRMLSEQAVRTVEAILKFAADSRSDAERP